MLRYFLEWLSITSLEGYGDDEPAPLDLLLIGWPGLRTGSGSSDVSLTGGSHCQIFENSRIRANL